MTFGSLFAGVGGMDLGLERAGLVCRWQVEINEFCRRVLAKHWPAVRRHDDVRTFPEGNPDDWRVDLIAGGFPCQDVSHAGDRAGIDGRQSGLWSEFARIVRVLRPRYVLVENTTGLLARGFGRVLGDLAASGYDAEWSVLPACALGASHPRARVFVVAHTGGERWRWERSGVGCDQGGEAEGHLRWPVDQPGLVRSLDGVPRRMDRLRGCGNAVAPAAAELIGRRIVAAESRLLG